MEVPEIIEIEETGDIEPDENSILKMYLSDVQKQKKGLNFSNKRTKELEILKKLRDSKTTIQIVVIINKDLKIEFTATSKELMSEI